MHFCFTEITVSFVVQSYTVFENTEIVEPQLVVSGIVSFPLTLEIVYNDIDATGTVFIIVCTCMHKYV